MTKLGEWLLGLTVFFGIYAALVTKQIKHQFIDDFFFEVQILPLVLIALLGVSVMMQLLISSAFMNHISRSTLLSQFSIGHLHSTTARKQLKRYRDKLRRRELI